VQFALPLAVLLGALAGAGLFVAVLAVVGIPERPAGKPPRRRRLPGGRELTTRLALGIGVGAIGLVLTHWVVAGLALGLLAAYWDRIAGGEAQERVAIARLEAMASWTESLRDTIAGAVGLEQAIPATAVNAGPVIRPSLNLLVDRLRIREPLPNALLSFAEDIDDPSADVICAALVLNARLRGPGLRDVLTALAISAREELDARRRIEASRKSVRRSVRIVLLIILGVMGLLTLLNRKYVQPYSTLTGELVLLMVVALLAAGLLWLRRLASPRRMERFLQGNPAAAVGTPGGSAANPTVTLGPEAPSRIGSS
jgi:Flp pilus assembly protein TadB